MATTKVEAANAAITHLDAAIWSTVDNASRLDTLAFAEKITALHKAMETMKAVHAEATEHEKWANAANAPQSAKDRAIMPHKR